MLTRKMIIGMGLSVLLCVSIASGTTYYVDPNGSDGADGLSWSTAFATIQHGIDEAGNYDIVEVNEGTYYENIDFNGVSCTLTSTDPNDWGIVEATIIDGNGSGAVVTFNSGEDENAVLKGLTIRNAGTYGIYCYGTSPVITDCIIEDSGTHGIYLTSSAAPVIERNKIRDNSSGIIVFYCSAGGVSIKNNWIYNNSNIGISAIFSSTSLTICNNTIVDNNSNGISAVGTSPTISNCIIWDNNDDLYGCSATYSCIEDGDSGTGNISSYPYFADFDGNDFHLTWNSPCINRGDPNYTGETDIDGEDRVIDSRVDIGADEFGTHAINLVKNPGFEEGVDGEGIPLYWEPWGSAVSRTVDPCEKHSGSYSWKFVNEGAENWYCGALSDWIAVEPNTLYEISCWVKCELGSENICFRWWEYDEDYNNVLYNENPVWYEFKHSTNPKAWENWYGSQITKAATRYIRIQLLGPCETTGTVWWDDFSLTKQGTEFLPAYGPEHEPNLAETVEFGGTERNLNWTDCNSSMTGPYTDPDDSNIGYRNLKPDWTTLSIGFPSFNVDTNDYNCPNTPMLLEIMYKDTTTSTDVQVSSRIDYMCFDPLFCKDPNGDLNDPNNYWSSREYRLTNLGGYNDQKWKCLQYGFQKSDFQLLRAIEGKYTIKIQNKGTDNLPIDYISLRKITQQEYEALTNRQRRLKNFYEANLPPDEPLTTPEYDDPNLVVFVRDIMRPVYKYTKPGPNEIDVNIVGFSTWCEVEPLSFSIYSENGINGLDITVSNLTHADGNTIDGNDISIYHVIYDEARLRYAFGGSQAKSYGLVPDRLEMLDTLSVDANSSERIWLKVDIPDEDAGLAAGLYEGAVTIKRTGQADVNVPIKFTIYDITLIETNYINKLAIKIPSVFSTDINEVFGAFVETGFDPFVSDYYNEIDVYMTEDANGNNVIDFNTTRFEDYLDRLIVEGVIREDYKNKVHISLSEWFSLAEVWNAVYKTSYDYDDPNLYYRLSDPCGTWDVNIGTELKDPNWTFTLAYKELIKEFISVGASRGVTFIFAVTDEPGLNARRRIRSDRLHRLIQDCNAKTTVTYYTTCDEPCPSGSYNVPLEGGNIPPLTDLVDFKNWSMNYQYAGYTKHQDPNYHGQFCYYTTMHAQIRNPVYNRFLHGLFAFRTSTTVVYAYAMGDYVSDPYNDFDAGSGHMFPFTYPDFLFAYPTQSGELLDTIGGLEGIREGIKDGRYIATLKQLISENSSNAVAQVAQEYLDELKGRINPDYYNAYTSQDDSGDLGYYWAILEDISDTNDTNDFEAFTEVRKKLAEFIGLLIDGNSYSVWNKTQNKFYTTIQGGINDANNEDELIVAQDTHYESIDFNGKNITLRSFDPNNWDVVAATIIDANNESSDAVTFASGEDANTALRGLTVTGATVGVYVDSVGPVISRCILRGNRTGVKYTKKSTGTSIVNNKIHDSNGYGVFGHKGSANIKNNWIYDSDKGIKLNAGASADIYNNTIVNNISYGIDKGGQGQVTISNCIIWDCNDDLYDCSATYSCISDCNDAAGTGNICGDANDPLFVAPDSNDFHLNSNSPCVDAGNPAGDYNDQTDIDGDERVLNGIVDIGADEMSFLPDAHWWKLNETSGITAYDSIDDDDGTFNGNDPCWVDGIFGGAIECNGVSDYFSIQSVSSDYVPYGNTFSAAGWFRTSQSTGMQTIVGNWNQYGFEPYPGRYFGWQVLVENNKVVARFGPFTAPSDITGTSDVNDGQWHHFALVFPTQDSNSILYVDGQSEGTPQKKWGLAASLKFRIGDGSHVSSGDPVIEGGPFNGTIDDVRIYDRILSAEEIWQLFCESGL